MPVLPGRQRPQRHVVEHGHMLDSSQPARADFIHHAVPRGRVNQVVIDAHAAPRQRRSMFHLAALRGRQAHRFLDEYVAASLEALHGRAAMRRRRQQHVHHVQPRREHLAERPVHRRNVPAPRERRRLFPLPVAHRHQTNSGHHLPELRVRLRDHSRAQQAGPQFAARLHAILDPALQIVHLLDPLSYGDWRCPVNSRPEDSAGLPSPQCYIDCQMPQIAESAARLPAAAPQPVPPASSPLHASGFVLVCVYLFTFYSRVLELTLPRVKIPLVLYIVLILALALSGSALRIFSSRAGMLICAFAGWLLCTVPFAWYKVGSLQASKSMFQTLGLVAAMIAFLRTPRQVVRALYSLAAGSLVAAVLSRLFGSSESGRLAMARGTLADPNEYAMILLIGFPFWLLAARNAKGNPVRKVLALGATIPGLSVLLMTGSRGGAVGLLTVGV